MADDIDIEEHDILENPRIQNILPHFQIKSEPQDADDAGEHYEEVPVNFEGYEYFDSQEFQADEMDDSYQDYSGTSLETYEHPRSPESDLSNEIYHHNNKIILGTKPCPKVQPPIILGTKASTQDPIVNIQGSITLASRPCPKSLKPVSYTNSQVSIVEETTSPLYAKPCPKSRKPSTSQSILRSLLTENDDDTESAEPSLRPERVLEDATVLLEDCSDHLESSQCYCNDCQILFATRNALDAHNMTAHSFLVALEGPDATDAETPENARYCHHCQSYFTDDNLLIQHLYDHLTMKNEAVKNEKLFYKCPTCYCYYAGMLRFATHMMRNHHTSLDNVKNFMVPFKTVCNICDKKTTLLSHNKHIQSVHNKQYLLKVKKNVQSLKHGETSNTAKKNDIARNVVPKTGNAVKIVPKFKHSGKVLTKVASMKEGLKNVASVTKVLYKCTKCKMFYNSKVKCLMHMRSKHPNDKATVQIISRKGKWTNQFQYYNTLLPKNVTFKCAKCDLHFLSAVAVKLHGCTKKKCYQCTECRRVFRDMDFGFHKEQHKHSDSIRTYKFDQNIYDKVLCKCMECNVYFHERQFLKHCYNGCSDVNAVWCTICKVKVMDLKHHKSNHSPKPAKSDFFYIDQFFSPAIFKMQKIGPDSSNKCTTAKSLKDSTEKKALKRKLPPNATDKAKVTFYYCEACSNFSKYIKCREFHVSKSCLSQTNYAAYCPDCGLRFRRGKPIVVHREGHAKYKWDMKDFVFLNIADSTPVSPPIPDFPNCNKCQVHCLNTHKCEFTKKTCNICHKTFDKIAYKLHSMHHKYLQPKNDDRDEVSELIQMYESLNPTWNIVYQCSECDIAADSYDRAIEHAQRHLADAPQSASKNCDVCGVRLDEISLKKHQELHQNRDVTKSSFNFFRYDYQALLTDDWFKLFKSLSEAEIKQITAPSIYVTRSVKMSVILDGPAEFTIYKCENCKNYVDSENVNAHTRRCSGSSSSFGCSTCGIPFSSLIGLQKHQTIHYKSNITANSYKIISFNSKTDKLFNNKLRSIEDSSAPVDTKRKVVFFQCKQCKRCSAFSTFFKKHICNELMTKSVTCDKCPFITTAKNKHNHDSWHAENKDLTRDDIRIVPFGKGEEIKFSDVRKRIWYKCSVCELLVFTPYTRHECPSRDAVECFKCNSKFHSRSYKYHLAEHMENSKLNKSLLTILPLVQGGKTREVVIPTKGVKADLDQSGGGKKRMWYQCFECRLLVPTAMSVHECYDEASTTECSKCDYKFQSRSYRHHLAEHAENANLTKRDIRVLPLGYSPKRESLNKVKSEKNETRSTLLFKCTCGLHFTSEPSVDKHMKFCSTDLIVLSEHCSECGLRVQSDLLSEHINKLHTGSKKVVVIIEATKKDDIAKDDKDTLKRNESTKLHKCQCGLCFFTAEELIEHFSTDDGTDGKTRVCCTQCGFIFTSEFIRKHVVLHHEAMGLSTADFTVCSRSVPCKSNMARLKKRNTVYKCGRCRMHFHKLVSANNHSVKCVSQPGTGSVCKVCNLRFHKNSLAPHNFEQHMQMKYTQKQLDIVVLVRSDNFLGPVSKKAATDETENDTERKLYKCIVCDVHYLKKTSLTDHMLGEHDVEKVECVTCGLGFTAGELIKHLSLHHVEMKLELKDFEIIAEKPVVVKVEPEDVSISKKVQSGSKMKGKMKPKDACMSSKQDQLNFNALETGVKVKIEPDDDSTSSNDVLNFSALGDEVKVKEEPKDASLKKVHFIFNCAKCDLNFLSISSLKKHMADDHKLAPVFNCEKCGLKFVKVSLFRHMLVHHGKQVQEIERVKFHDITQMNSAGQTLCESNILYKCTLCDSVFVCVTSLIDHLTLGNHDAQNMSECTECGLSFSRLTLQRHKLIHHTQRAMTLEDFDIRTIESKTIFLRTDNDDSLVHVNTEPSDKTLDDLAVESRATRVASSKSLLGKTLPEKADDLNQSTVFELDTDGAATVESQLKNQAPETDKSNTSTDKESDDAVSQSSDLDSITNEEVKQEKTNVKLYKCSECNVYFLNQSTCYKHTLNHTALDPKEYIECKLCSLQFKIMSLAQHIKKHHSKAFELSDVLVEEYQPKRKGQKTPKIDIYYAIDKVQSRLVSTTTEDENGGKSNLVVSQVTESAESSEIRDVLEDAGPTNRLVEDDADMTSNIESCVESFKDVASVETDTCERLKKESVPCSIAKENKDISTEKVLKMTGNLNDASGTEAESSIDVIERKTDTIASETSIDVIERKTDTTASETSIDVIERKTDTVEAETSIDVIENHRDIVSLNHESPTDVARLDSQNIVNDSVEVPSYTE